MEGRAEVRILRLPTMKAPVLSSTKALTASSAQGNVTYMAVCQNLVPLVNIKIAGKWMFIPLKMVLLGIDPFPYNVILP